MPSKPHHSVEIEIESLGIYGEGVGRLESHSDSSQSGAAGRGLTVFVEGALPQERILAQIHERKKSFARAKATHFFTKSPHRVSPTCRHFGSCGGCQLMHLHYSGQLETKRIRVADALQRIGKIQTEVLPCIPSPSILAYRNKIQLMVNSNKRLGLHAQNTHTLIEVDRCAIHCPLGEKIVALLHTLLKNDPDSSDLVHIVVKTAVNTSQALIILATKKSKPPISLAKSILQSAPEIKGVVQHFEETYTLLAGQPAIEEEICNLRFKVSPPSFFQVNPAQAEALYQSALVHAHVSDKDTVLDAYCGVGTLSLIFAQHAKEVIGIEFVPEAIDDAKENAERNHIKNAQFFCGPAETCISEVGLIDIALLNPPRKGCEPAFLNALVQKNPARILYISCDPATLARDLHILTQQGYQVMLVQPFDMFPQTMHVECLVVLKRLLA